MPKYVGEMPSGGHNKVYSPAVVDTIVAMLSDGATLSEAAKAVGVNMNTITQWRAKYPEFDRECTRAIIIGTDSQVDLLFKIADSEPDVQRARLKCDNIKWATARRNPAKYGDKLDVNLNQTVDISAALLEAKQRLLSPRDQEDAIETEGRVITNAIGDTATDSQSVVPQNGDAGKDSDDDIFS